MTVDRLELEALAYAAWPSSSPEDRFARKMVEILARNKHGPNGPYSMRASAVGIELSKSDPAAFRDLKGLKAIVAHAAPHIIVVDDPTCEKNPTNAALRLLHKSLRSRTRPQLHQLASQQSAESSIVNDSGSESSGGEDGTLPPSLRTPDQLSRSSVLAENNVAPAASLDLRLLALAAYPIQHRPAHSLTFEDNLQHLRCATACFLLSPECTKGPVGPYSATGARVSNVLRASLGVKWGAVGGKGSRLNLIQDKVISLRPYTTQQDAVALQLDLGKLQERAMRSVAKVLPSGPTDTSIPLAPPSGPLMKSQQPKPGVNPIVQDVSNLPLQPEIEGALAPLLHAAFPGSSPLHVVQRKAAVLLMAYSVAVHGTHPGNSQDADPVPEPDPEGWQLCTKRKPAAQNRRAPSIADIATSANGFGAMPCTFLGSALHKMMPQKYVQLPTWNGGKHLRAVYHEVPCFVKYPGPRQSESYLKLDVPLLAAMGGHTTPDDLRSVFAAIAAIGGASHSHLPPPHEEYSLISATRMPPLATESGPSLPASETQQSAAMQAQQSSNGATQQCSNAAYPLPPLASESGPSLPFPEAQQSVAMQAQPVAQQSSNGATQSSNASAVLPPAQQDSRTWWHSLFTTPPAFNASTATMSSGAPSSAAMALLQGFAPQPQGCVSLPAPAAALPTESGGGQSPGCGMQAAGGEEAEPDLLSLLLEE